MISRTLRVFTILVFVAACGDGYGSDDDGYALESDRDDATGDAGAKDAGAAKDAGPKDGGATPSDAGVRADAGARDAGKDAAVGDAGGGAACAELTYETFGKQFLTKYCVSCHSGAAPRGGLALDTLAGLQARKSGVKTQVANGNMPQGSNKPSAEERTRLGQWIDCGAL